MFKPLLISFLFIFIFSCSNSEPNYPKIDGRDYSQPQVDRGKNLYLKNCQSCHAKDAVGADNYHQMASQGIFLTPPLNNNSMLWHRDFSDIYNQISNGTLRFKGGKMPAFKDQLNKQDINNIIFYLMSLWDDETYQRWKNEVNHSPIGNK